VCLRSLTSSHPTHFDPEDEGIMFLQNVGICLQDCVLSQPRGP
jgi:hypothetical protein